MLKRLLIALAAVAALGLLSLQVVKSALERWSSTELMLNAPVDVDFSRGTSLNALTSLLLEKGVIDSDLKFKLWVKQSSDFRQYQAGLYRFEGATSPQRVIRDLVSGAIYEPVVVEYVIPEGFNFRMIKNRFVAHGLGTAAKIQEAWYNKQMLAELKVPSTSFEGYLYPSTYRFSKQIDVRDAIKAGVALFWKNLPPDYEKKANALGISLAQAVTFASLIEVETKLDEEREKVSEVIWRRLRNKEPIGIDAALIYGIKDYQGDIKRSHLKDAKNPYNTRIHRGLPPTPIGSTAISSLKAVLNPTNEGYYYYVRDIDTEDGHFFSRTHAEHQRYVAKLVAKTRVKNSKQETPTPKK